MLPEIQERTRKKHERTCSTCLAAGGGQSPPSWWLVFVMFCTCSFMFCLYFGQIHALVFGEQFSTRGMFFMSLLYCFQSTCVYKYRTSKIHPIFWSGVCLCDLQVIMHYIPLAEVARRLMCNRNFKGISTIIQPWLWNSIQLAKARS